MVAGRITSETGEPLDGAIVYLEATRFGAIAKDDGRYSFLVPTEGVTETMTTLIAKRSRCRLARFAVMLSGAWLSHDFKLSCTPEYLPAPKVFPTYDEALAEIADITRASGLSDLRAERKNGAQMIRVWLWYSQRFDLFRLTRDAGKTFGQHLWFRRLNYRCSYECPEPLPPPVDGSCRTIRSGDFNLCPIAQPERANWTGLWKSLEMNRVFELSDEAQSAQSTDSHVDPFYLTVESWDGKNYRIRLFEAAAPSDSGGRRQVEAIKSIMEKFVR